MIIRLRQIRNRLSKFLHRRAVFLYLAGLGIIVSIFIGSALLLDRHSSQAYEQLFSQQQEIKVYLARQAVQEHFNSIFKEAESLARTTLPSLIQQGLTADEINHLLSRQYNMYPDVVFIEYSGNKEMEAAPALSRDEKNGKSFWTRQYLHSALCHKESIFIPPLFVYPQQQLLAVMTPVIQSNTAHGVLTAILDLQNMAKNFIKPMRTGTFGSVYLLDGKGNIVYHSQTHLIGNNVFSGIHDAYPERLQIDHQMTNLLSGSASCHYPLRTGDPEISRKLISWNSLRMGEQRLIIVLTAPSEEITSTLKHLRMQILLSGCLLGGTMLAMSLFFFRRRELHQLRDSEKKYRHLVEGIEEMVYTLDLNDQFTYVSPAALQVTGYRPSELVGATTRTLTHPDDIALMEAFRNHLMNGLSVSNEFRILHKDGSIRYVESNNRPLFQGTRIVGITGMLFDITRRKMQEEQLKRGADELQKINEEVKQFVFIVSHDLRTPLVNLKAYSRELQTSITHLKALLNPKGAWLPSPSTNELSHLLDKEIPESLDFIKHAVTRIDQFINAVMSLARQGARELKPEPINMNELTENILKNLAHKIEERSIHVTVHPLPDVVADRLAMEQIMGNILTNAVNYLVPGRPGEIEISGEKNHAKAVFRIRDNGRGIAVQEKSKVFAPFRRIHADDVPGEGMGLAYVQTLVRRHGGHITYESIPDVGTTFIFTLSLLPPVT
jgi:PAS domain S-box-containing protein